MTGVQTCALPISVVATSSPGTDLHSIPAVASPGTIDEIYLSAVNLSLVDQKLTIQFGGTSAGDSIPITVPPGVGIVPILNGQRLASNTSTATVVKAFADNASQVNVFLTVNRITL